MRQAFNAGCGAVHCGIDAGECDSPLHTVILR
jgi:hypothetical protein